MNRSYQIMSSVFTITTELKLNKEYNQLFGKYITDYIKLFNKIQRLTFHRIKNYYIKNGKITQKDRNIIHAQLKEEFNLFTIFGAKAKIELNREKIKKQKRIIIEILNNFLNILPPELFYKIR